MKISAELMDAVKSEYEKAFPWQNESVFEMNRKNISGIVKLENGNFYIFRKPSIETQFYFDFDERFPETVEKAREQAQKAREKDGFIAENMRQFECREKAVSMDFAKQAPAYPGHQGRLCHIAGFDCGPDPENAILLTKTDKATLKEENSRQAEAFRKRLESYWKRYGNRVIRAKTYSTWD